MKEVAVEGLGQTETMNEQLLYQEHPAFQSRGDLENIQTMFFKCVRWQVEETTDPINCPYHYFCDSNYPGNYPPSADILVFLITTASYLTTLFFTVIEISRGKGRPFLGESRRSYLLPNGPVFLPLILLSLAKGQRINSIIPLQFTGPAILQLLYISALAFEKEGDKDIKYAIFETSVISGILHASLYLDSIILPYYTGFDALVSSTFSGVCETCVCRKEALVAGGTLIYYRGWSITTFFAVATLCLRIVYRLATVNRVRIIRITLALESLGWILITVDCVYLMLNSPVPGRTTSRVAVFGAILVLICLHVIRKICIYLLQWPSELSVRTSV